MKFAPAAAALAALLLAVPSHAGPVAAVKAEASVESDVVRLGDLIDNAGAASSIPVFHAPALGTSGTIQMHRVIEAAQANGIALVNTRGLNEVAVIRAARTVPLGDLERAAAEAAAQQLGLNAEDISIRFDRDVRPLQIEATAEGETRIANFSYNPHTQRFQGTVDIPGSTIMRRAPVHVTGGLQETAEVATLARSLSRGEVLRESDILLERRPRSEIAADAVTRLDAAIGQATRRALRAGHTLRPADLMKPDLVARNETVTILFEMRGISLTARGKALDSGAEGEAISVVNAHSNRVLQGTVKGPGLVVVGHLGALASNVTGSVR